MGPKTPKSAKKAIKKSPAAKKSVTKKSPAKGSAKKSPAKKSAKKSPKKVSAKKSPAKAASKKSPAKASKSPKKSPKKKGGKDGKPKRALSAFMMFANSNRQAIMTKLGLQPRDIGPIGKALGEAWGKLSAADKKPYDDMAAKDKVRYEKEKAAAGL